MSEKCNSQKPSLVPKTTKMNPSPKKTPEEELYASMAQCLDVIPAEKPDPANLNILKGKRPNIREIAWYWLPANQENLSEPGHCRTFTIPEATNEEITASDLSLPKTLLENSYGKEHEISEPSTSSELLLTETDSSISSSLLSSDFASLTVSNKPSSDEISYKSSSDEKIVNKASSSSKMSSQTEKENPTTIKKTRFKGLPSIERSIASKKTEEENVEENIHSMPSSGKFINIKSEETGNYKLDKFTHGFYELLEVEEEQASAKSQFTCKAANIEPQTTSESDITSRSFETNTSTSESFHLIDPIPIHPPSVSERSPEVPFNRSASPTSDTCRVDNNFNVDLISARSKEDEPKGTELTTPRDEEFYVCGHYSIYPIAELTEPSSCNSDFEEPLVGFDEFHQMNPKKQSRNPACKIDTSQGEFVSECLTDSEFETEESSESDNDNNKLHMFNIQELEKLPKNKAGVRFKRILKVNGKHIYDCKCNYHLLPARYQKKYRNPENLLLEFNYLLLPNDKTVYFSSHYCPYTVQEMHDIMEITGGLKYLPQSYIMQYILHNKYQKSSKKLKLRTASFLESKEMVVSLVQRPSITEIPVQEESLTTEVPRNSQFVIPSIEERQASRSNRPTTRRWDSIVKRPSE